MVCCKCGRNFMNIKSDIHKKIKYRLHKMEKWFNLPNDICKLIYEFVFEYKKSNKFFYISYNNYFSHSFKDIYRSKYCKKCFLEGLYFCAEIKNTHIYNFNSNNKRINLMVPYQINDDLIMKLKYKDIKSIYKINPLHLNRWYLYFNNIIYEFYNIDFTNYKIMKNVKEKLNLLIFNSNIICKEPVIHHDCL